MIANIDLSATGDNLALIETLLSKLQDEEIDAEAYTVITQNPEALKHMCTLLNDTECQEKASQLLAELAKQEVVRAPCVDAGLIKPLLALLESSSVPTVIQACRALGNICFDNDAARYAVDSEGGVEVLLRLLRKYQHTPENADNDRLRLVAAGFLLNVTNTHECVQACAVSGGVLEILDEYLQQHAHNTDLLHMLLLCIGSITDSEYGKDHLSECKIAVTVGNLLANLPCTSDQNDTILELLAAMADADEVKQQLAESSLPQHLISMLHSLAEREEDEAVSLTKLIADLIVLILTGDGSMKVLYASGGGVLYKECLTWLQSPSEHMQMSGALAIGNFARNDDQCCELVSAGIATSLMRLLTNTTADGSVTLQHAIFSALRNLAIPAQNKALLLEAGLIDSVMPFINTDMMMVLFKLLGLLRMVVDKHESAATRLGSDEVFMTRLIELCAVDDHAGVKGEANRLVAWLVKNSPARGVVQCVVTVGCVPYLVTMANAEHAVMQNEALLALTLAAAKIPDVAIPAMKDAEIVAALKVILSEDSAKDEIMCNVLSLCKTLSAANSEVKEQMIIAELHTTISTNSKVQNYSDSQLKQLAKDVLKILGK